MSIKYEKPPGFRWLSNEPETSFAPRQIYFGDMSGSIICVAITASYAPQICVFIGLDPTPKNPRAPPRHDDSGGLVRLGLLQSGNNVLCLICENQVKL